MSVVINSNAAATVAANNLAASNTALQKSLNRLSSGSKIVNPADDAGGLAVSMKLSAAARRQGAVESNIANATSLLQTQDGVLSVTAKILNRISELKVLNNDVTKSSSDKANYDSEFKALQAQIAANATEKFNGVALFGSKDMTVRVTEDGNTQVTAKAIDLLGNASGFATFTDNFSSAANWSLTGSPSFSGGILSANMGDSANSIAKFAGPFELTVKVQGPTVIAGVGDTMATVATEANDGAWHTLKLTGDGIGSHSATLDGVSVSSGYLNSGTPPSISLVFGGVAGQAKFKDLQIRSTATTPTNVGNVAGATDLSSLSLGTITGAIEDTATYRAQNGATQSRFGFASELVTVNKANLEAANSRITDVDVAQESTVLARNNVLVSAGTSMLAQANQSSQMALKLLS